MSKPPPTPTPERRPFAVDFASFRRKAEETREIWRRLREAQRPTTTAEERNDTP